MAEEAEFTESKRTFRTQKSRRAAGFKQVLRVFLTPSGNSQKIVSRFLGQLTQRAVDLPEIKAFFSGQTIPQLFVKLHTEPAPAPLLNTEPHVKRTCQ